MYEHFRNDFQSAAFRLGLDPADLPLLLGALDQVAAGYDITRKELALVPYGDELPDMVKTYLVCKRIEGLSDHTLSAYMRTLQIFFRSVRQPPDRISPNDIRVFLYSYQQERGCSSRSLDKYRSYLSGFFSWATDEGYLTRNPTRTIAPIKYERKPRRNLYQLELEQLRSSCISLRDRAMIEFLYSTGCRVSELTAVKLADIDWTARTVRLFGKGRKHRISYLNARAEVALKAYLSSRQDDCEFLFVTMRQPFRPLTRAAVEKVVRILSTNAGSRISPHILRHTTATIALQNGMPIADISALLGHENIDTTMIYAHTSTDSVQSGHRKYVV